VALARSVATSKKAMEMLLTGTPVSASEALEIGLINRVVPDDELDANVAGLAHQIASASAQTLAIGKPAFYRQIELDRPAAYDVAQQVMVDNLLKEDAHEGITAFLQKRDPEWKY
jgi:enoyl-CoA hydratase/carnithine racemase